jgi:hypothetical protein
MRTATGAREARFHVGDRVSVARGTGTVVGVLERREYARDLEAWRWFPAARGLIVLLDDGHFIHVGEPAVSVRRLSGYARSLQ